eukprot:TRINITY_DN72308_c0_g1_i1.p1 TRINITY_DN72308_c0_g1~~TRINITY_DN72308_c0_g1_i1.p1  ORF type:complete len:236 (-),score=25.15 TRINITY_DN72308_c0_g1_i1:17-724(-)
MVEQWVMAGAQGGAPNLVRQSRLPVQKFEVVYTDRQMDKIMREGERLAIAEGMTRVTPRAPLGDAIVPAPTDNGKPGSWIVVGNSRHLRTSTDDPPVQYKGHGLIDIGGEVVMVRWSENEVVAQMVETEKGKLDVANAAVNTKGATVAEDEVSASDARILPIQIRNGERHRTWAEAVDMCKEEAFNDWPVKGPRTMGFCLDFTRRRHIPLDHHVLFRQIAKLNPEQWGVQEHELC